MSERLTMRSGEPLTDWNATSVQGSLSIWLTD
jgi:hypothetical protein